MVLLTFSGFGKWTLVHTKEFLNRTKYVRLLSDNLLPWKRRKSLQRSCFSKTMHLLIPQKLLENGWKLCAFNKMPRSISRSSQIENARGGLGRAVHAKSCQFDIPKKLLDRVLSFLGRYQWWCYYGTGNIFVSSSFRCYLQCWTSNSLLIWLE